MSGRLFRPRSEFGSMASEAKEQGCVNAQVIWHYNLSVHEVRAFEGIGLW